MALETWIANTAAKASAAIAGDELLRLVDDPGGTPSSKKATVDALLAYYVTKANTWTANGAASTPSQLLNGTWFSGGSATTTKPQFLIEPAGATSTGWSTSGTGLGVNAASGFLGHLFNFQVNGAWFARLLSTGLLELSANGSAGGGIQIFSDASNVGMQIGWAAGAPATLRFSSAGIISWTASSAQGGTPDLFLVRDAANTLAQRNGTAAQTLRVYNTFTDASNYERGVMSWDIAANRFSVGAQAAGTGTLRPLDLYGSGIQFKVTVGTAWEMNGSGHLLAGTDNTYDIGASGATRPRDIFIARNAKIGGDIEQTTATSAIYWVGRSVFRSPANGVISILNNAETDFGRLQFGGTTSSFPALKRAATVLQAVLADDSGFAPLQGRLRVHANAVAETPTATHTMRVYDAAGTEYKVLCIAA